ncbi:DNA mismatch repair protein MutS, partial [candidate division KSB1 bacterium]|nr:DNA mismatch repair protein MutS [candidate division KSB1 bacterium]
MNPTSMDSVKATTPLMEQYLAIKNRYKDAVLFFRMGDFFEMFYQDARIGAQVLGITLTSRAHGKSADVPLAGFPHHALDVYLAKMIKAGYRVAVCEQIEDPKKAKGIVKREVVEVVTPGTAVSDDLLETKRNNYLLALCPGKSLCGLAVADVSTGEFQVGELDWSDLPERVDALDPAEILLQERDAGEMTDRLRLGAHITLTRREDWTFQYDYAYETLTDHFGTLSLKGFGLEELTVGISAAGAILGYLRENQTERLVHINRISLLQSANFLLIDATTRRNLELVRSMTRDGKQGTLLAMIDRTHTPMGGRMLVNWLSYPLVDIAAINKRLDAVQELLEEHRLTDELGNALRDAGDLERLLARFATSRANARDARMVLETLRICTRVRELLSGTRSDLLEQSAVEIDPLAPLADEIDRALVENPPLSITDGNIIRPHYHAKLDELRSISFSGKDWIAQLQTQERERTGITSLKVNYNKVFGYYIEVTRPNLNRVPSHYIRKQTLVNAERFITQDLKEYEEKVLGAEEKMAAIEYELFDALRRKILEQTKILQNNARLLASVDCLLSLAIVASENAYHRPELTNDDTIAIRDSRHPVVEKMIRAGEPFIANDVHLDNTSSQILIITGPNMAGKSTYLRQIGLIVILAHMGSFVPASEAHIGIVDRVFTRVGASDNLTAGEST